MLPIGYAEEAPEPTARMGLSRFTHQELWSE
jgi:hypothetical protein